MFKQDPEDINFKGSNCFPTFEVRGTGLECQAATAQERPRGATPHPKSGAAAGRRHPESEVRAAAGRSYPTSKEQWLHGRSRA